MAIVFFTLLGMAILLPFQPEWMNAVTPAFCLGALLICAVSWADDLRSVPSYLRFGIHSIAALLIMAAGGYWQVVKLPVLGMVDLGAWGAAITFIWIVGLTNAYNFMDGIDGIAGTQGVMAGIGWLILGYLTGYTFAGALGALIAVACLGFLVHNWPPARIFMGDVGSAFLGYAFASIAVIASKANPSLALAGIILVWPFVFDTGFTLARRLRAGENIFAAHRSHLYQRLVISGYSHRTVTLLYTLLDAAGLVFALMIVSNESWAEVIPVIISIPACFSLWAFTIMREKCIKAGK